MFQGVVDPSVDVARFHSKLFCDVLRKGLPVHAPITLFWIKAAQLAENYPSLLQVHRLVMNSVGFTKSSPRFLVIGYRLESGMRHRHQLIDYVTHVSSVALNLLSYVDGVNRRYWICFGQFPNREHDDPLCIGHLVCESRFQVTIWGY